MTRGRTGNTVVDVGCAETPPGATHPGQGSGRTSIDAGPRAFIRSQGLT